LTKYNKKYSKITFFYKKYRLNIFFKKYKLSNLNKCKLILIFFFYFILFNLLIFIFFIWLEFVEQGNVYGWGTNFYGELNEIERSGVPVKMKLKEIYGISRIECVNYLSIF
jgi:hypothetical protein